MVERRQATRYDAAFRAHLTDGDDAESSYFAFISDLSLTGCRAIIDKATPEAIGRGRAISIHLMETDLRVRGIIVRVSDVVPGWGMAVGVDFQDEDPLVRESLIALCRRPPN